MPKQPDLKRIANEIRAYIRSQDWKPFLQYEGVAHFTNPYQIMDGCLAVFACGACIRCANGEVLDIMSRKPATDRDVVHLYTSRYMTGGALTANATTLLAQLQKDLKLKH